MNGKAIRLAKLFSSERRTCIVPIDHAITYGPISGLQNPYQTIHALIKGGVDAIVLHKGILSNIYKYEHLQKGNYILHLSGSTSLGNSQSLKVNLGLVEEGIRLGATGISIHINLGSEKEHQMLKNFGAISEKCYSWGMPLLAMMYIENATKTSNKISHAARVAQEIGADIVKIDFPGTIEGVQEIVAGTQIPVLIAGGEKIESSIDFLKLVNLALIGGASGISVGRNIFQNSNPQFITQLTSKLIHKRYNIDDCKKALTREVLDLSSF